MSRLVFRTIAALFVTLSFSLEPVWAESGSGDSGSDDSGGGDNSGSGGGGGDSGGGGDNSGSGGGGDDSGGGGDNSGSGGGDDSDSDNSGSGSGDGGRGRGRGGDHDRARDAVREGRALPLSAFRSRIEQRYRGRVIDATVRERRGGLVYELKMLSKAGRVFIVSIDARTGQPKPVPGS